MRRAAEEREQHRQELARLEGLLRDAGQQLDQKREEERRVVRSMITNRRKLVDESEAKLANLQEEIAAKAAAVANQYFVAAINRVGREAEYGDNEFYGTSYFADPRGQLGVRDRPAHADGLCRAA